MHDKVGAWLRHARVIVFGLVAFMAVHRETRAAFPTRLIKEPVFGLYFAPAKARFETMRLMDAPEPCRKTLLRNYVPGARLLIYADQTSPTARILILGDRNGGLLLMIRAGQCGAIDAPPTLIESRRDPLAPEFAPSLRPAEIRQVFADVLARYTRAFGGKQLFFAWLDTVTRAMLAGCEGQPESSCPPTWHTLPADLQAMLQASRHD